jgi:hypothetical protein
MENLIKLELTQDEAATFTQELERVVAGMKKAHEQMMIDQIEIDRLKAETNVVLADLARMLGENDVETSS